MQIGSRTIFQKHDHILASVELYGRFRRLEAHNETLADEAVGFAKALRSAGSYHAPVVAEFATEKDSQPLHR